MKTYSTASNARRAARTQLTNTQAEKPVEGVDFTIEGDKETGFSWRRIQIAPAAELVVAQAEPKAKKAPKANREPTREEVRAEAGPGYSNPNEPKPAPEAPAPVVKDEPKARTKGAVAAIWEICEECKGWKRKDVIQYCVDQGLNYYTARTQYQEWFKATKNSQPKK